jgi:hypothetical protein
VAARPQIRARSREPGELERRVAERVTAPDVQPEARASEALAAAGGAEHVVPLEVLGVVERTRGVSAPLRKIAGECRPLTAQNLR